MDNYCQVEQIDDKLFRCKLCKFEHKNKFVMKCPSFGDEQSKPFQCKYLGQETGKIDKKYCSCGNKQADFSVHFCEKYKVQCGLFTMLNYYKKKEVLDSGARNCSTCEDRFTP